MLKSCIELRDGVSFYLIYELSPFLRSGSCRGGSANQYIAVFPIVLPAVMKQQSAVLYSLMCICKLHSVNPFIWLRDILQRINNHPINKVADLLPPN